MREIVTARIALKLKELGFNEPTQNRYIPFDTPQGKMFLLNRDGKLRFGEPINYNDKCFQDKYREYSSAPTHAHAINWLWRMKQIEVNPPMRVKNLPDKWYIFREINLSDLSTCTTKLYDFYEEALDASILKSINEYIESES